MTKKEETRASKFLSLVLRHKPETIDLNMDVNGWAEVEELLLKLEQSDVKLSLESLQAIVANNDKKRFAFSSDLKKIRASQGHSLNIDLNLKKSTPPAILFHGTAEKNIGSIKEKGLLKGERQHVHLSTDIETARKVGSRHGKPVVLKVSSEEMHISEIVFYKSKNGVWLTNRVQPRYIAFP